ncbi:MAG: hypothetical protein FWC01_04080 [Treponema sp.]|nr:hypothetical protein [Treponema sp.]
MTLIEVMKMDTAAFQEACKAAEIGITPLGPINSGTKTFEAAVKSFNTFESTPESILAIHKTGQACP